MAWRGQLELKASISSANNLKNVSLGHRPIRAYAIVSAPPNPPIRTRTDLHGHTSPTWNETHYISLVTPDESTTLLIDLYHHNEPGDNDTIIGSACLPVMVIINDVGFGQDYRLSLPLSRPSGRFQGTVDVTFAVRDSTYREPYRNPGAPYADHPMQSQPAVAVGYPPGTAGTAYASKMRNNHHRQKKKKQEMWTRLVVCAVALCLLLWAFLSYVEFENVGAVEKNQEEERFLMIMCLGLGLIALELGMLALMELMTRWTTLPTMWPRGLMVAGDSDDDDDDGFGSDGF